MGSTNKSPQQIRILFLLQALQSPLLLQIVPSGTGDRLCDIPFCW